MRKRTLIGDGRFTTRVWLLLDRRGPESYKREGEMARVEHANTYTKRNIPQCRRVTAGVSLPLSSVSLLLILARLRSQSVPSLNLVLGDTREQCKLQCCIHNIYIHECVCVCVNDLSEITRGRRRGILSPGSLAYRIRTWKKGLLSNMWKLYHPRKFIDVIYDQSVCCVLQGIAEL